VRAAAEFGVHLSRHSSRALSIAHLERSDALILLDDDTEWRIRQMSPNLAAEVVTLPGIEGSGPETFPAIAAALTRLAQAVERELNPRPRTSPADAAAPCSQAA
jgi:protein-tyrosine-phosphatase